MSDKEKEEPTTVPSKIFTEIYWTLRYIDSYRKNNGRPLNMKEETRKLIKRIDSLRI